MARKDTEYGNFDDRENIFRIHNFQGGMHDKIYDYMIPDNAFTDCENVDLDEGILSKRGGKSDFNTTALSDICLGLYTFRKNE